MICYKPQKWLSMHQSSQSIDIKADWQTPIDRVEIEQVYAPLAVYIDGLFRCHEARYYKWFQRFPAVSCCHLPPVFVIGITGSVAAGKTTVAAILMKLLQSLAAKRVVACVSTDHFLQDNATIEATSSMMDKGFPWTYHYDALFDFIEQCKNRREKNYEIPIYSHDFYDIMPNQMQRVCQPDILLVEGVVALQSKPAAKVGEQARSLSEVIDWGLYLDVDETLLWQRFLSRFERMRQEARGHKQSFFYQWSELSVTQAEQVAREYWLDINLKNLRRYIQPTRDRAHCVLQQGFGACDWQIRMKY